MPQEIDRDGLIVFFKKQRDEALDKLSQVERELEELRVEIADRADSERSLLEWNEGLALERDKALVKLAKQKDATGYDLEELDRINASLHDDLVSVQQDYDAARAELEHWELKGHKDTGCNETVAVLRTELEQANKDIKYHTWRADWNFKCSQEDKAELKRLKFALDSSEGSLTEFQNTENEDLTALSRLYAVAVNRADDLQATLDAVRAESTRQTEEIRRLRAAGAK